MIGAPPGCTFVPAQGHAPFVLPADPDPRQACQPFYTTVTLIIIIGLAFKLNSSMSASPLHAYRQNRFCQQPAVCH